MEYEIYKNQALSNPQYIGAVKAGKDASCYSQDIKLIIGITGEKYGATIEANFTIENIPLSLGENIPNYILEKCNEYINTNFPNY